jgi:3-oxoacyl-[acyl-carrier protein] reductase
MLLSSKTALITGASKGIGEAIAELFAQQGANLVLMSRDMGKLMSLKNRLEYSYAVQVAVYKADVSNIEEVKAAFKHINADKISINIIVNNAGVMLDGTLMMMKQETIKQNLDVNTLGTINVTQSAIKLLIKNRGGVIINMTSIIGTNGSSGQSVYSASKSAIVGFTKSLSKELSALNIRVNSIAPGFIATDMTTHVPIEKTVNSIGLGRIGQPIDVANVALFLASDLSSYVTGQIIGVDGGMVI